MSQPYPLSLNGIRWVDVWKDQLIQNLACKDNNDCAGIWDTVSKAKEFWRSACMNRNRYNQILRQISEGGQGRILDIGGGPGTLAIPLAGQGHTVTVVEPARGMVSVLQENITARNISRIRIVNKRWEEVIATDLDGPYDTVVSCFSLGMPDIDIAIKKMEETCSGTIFLVWFAGKTPWEHAITALWPLYHEKPYIPGPKADILLQVLWQMGIFPDVRVCREKYVAEYGQMSDIAKDYAQRLCLPDDADTRPVHEYLRGLSSGQAGTCTLPGELTFMILSWKTCEGTRV